MPGSIIALSLWAVVATLLFSRRLQNSRNWQATVTPLASIIGSGFLVSVPLLVKETGNWAVFAMISLVAVAYLVGAAIRFNIRYAEPLFAQPDPDGELRIAESLERLSHFVLAFAYFISVTYYLMLLSNFLLNGFGIQDETLARTITTIVLVALGSLGFLKGLSGVERIEKYTVGINLAIIAGLLGALLWLNGEALLEGSWRLGDVGSTFSLESVQVLLGLLIVVQGFETSRFMGDEYDAETRIRTMRYAQWISTCVYVLFFLLMTILFPELGDDTGITAIIGLVGHVALVLPIMLTLGAIASQFSAAVADSIGCAGLIENVAGRRINVRHAYPIIAVIAIVLAWDAPIFRIITLASQAFALFYFIEGCVALAVAHEKRDLPNRVAHMLLWACVSLICLSVVLFGIPSGG